MDATTIERPAVAEEVIDRAEVRDGKPLVRYGATEAALAALRQQYQGVQYDLTTTSGDKAARAARLQLVTLRTGLEKRRKEFKAPAIEFGKLIDAEAARITTEIMALENPIDAQIKADEQRRAEERAAREKAEAERKAKLQAGVDGMAGFIRQAQQPGMTAARLASGISVLEGLTFPAEQWQEYHAAAVKAHAEALDYLRTAHAGAVEREAEAARLAAERAELERQREAQRQEQARIDAEAARLKDAEMEREAAEHRAMEAERLAALTADAPKPQDDDTMDGPVTTGAPAGLLQDDCAGLSKALASKPDAMANAREAAQMINGLTAAETLATASVSGLVLESDSTPATLELGDINARMGVTMTADFVATALGMPWRDTANAAKLWRESDWPLIKAALVKHVEGLL